MALNTNKLINDLKNVAKYGSYLYNPTSWVIDSSVNTLKSGYNALKNRYTLDNSKSEKTPSYPTLSTYTGGGSSGGSGSGSSYLSGLISAYNQSADADRAVAQQVYDTTVRNLNTALGRAEESYNTGVSNANRAYDTTASSLLRSLERFQNENKKNVELQKRNYLSEQAALEDARFEADRQNRISAASRGIGGSGLQQLAQLQTLLSQGQDISELALANRNALGDLREQLMEAQEDYDTDLANAQATRDDTLASLLTALNNAREDNTNSLNDALRTYQNTLNSINANLADKTATARANAAASAAASSKSSGSLKALLTNLQDSAEADIKSVANASKSELRTIAKNLGYSNPSKVTKKDIIDAYIMDTITASVESNVSLDDYNKLKSNLNAIRSYYGY